MKKTRSVKALGSSACRMLNVVKYFSLILTLAFFAGVSAAAPALDLQDSSKALSGVVKDEAGNPLVGVAVLAKGTTVGVVTSGDGTFQITVPANTEELQFTFLGLKTLDVPIGTQTRFNVTMEAEMVGIDDVVVIGYGTLQKKDISTSIASVRGEDLEDRTSAFNIMQSISGKVAGVKNVSFSGKPGGSSALRIRGMGSINAGKDPIYVLDGVVGVDPDIINSSNIESIDVLKDAAATAMYGAQGSNGVVIITTKKGEKGTGTITYDGRVGFGFLNRKMDLLNADEFMQVQERAYAYSGKYMPHLETIMDNLFDYKMEGNSYARDENGNYIASPKYDTDWQKAITQTAITNDHIVSFSSSNDRTSVYSSVAMQDFQGLVKETYSSRFTGTVNVNTRIKEWFHVQTVATAGQNKGNDMEGGFTQGPVRNMIEMPPIVPVKYEDGTWGRKNDYDLGEDGENPILLLREQKKEWNTNFAVFNLIATIDFTKNLSFTAKGDYQMTNRKNIEFAPEGLLDVSVKNGGYAELKQLNTKKLSSENYFTYNNSFFNDRLYSSYVLGGSWYYTRYEDFSAGSEQYFDPSFGYHNLGAGTTFRKPTSSMYKNTMNSYYFRMNHTWDNKYLLGFTFRADGASNFGKNNRYGYFPSASAAWRISEENFFEPAKKVVSDLKLRASYGVVGNASIPNYRTISSYKNNSIIFDKELYPYVLLDNMANADLKWETSHQLNFGLDLSLFNNRLEIITDFYRKSTKDLLFEKQVPYTTGYSKTWTNLGEIRNTGFEFTITSRNIHRRDFLWTTNLIYTTNKLKVVDIGGETIDTANNTIAREGEEWASYHVFKRLGTWGLDEVEEAARYGKKPGDIKYWDRDNNGVIDDEDRVIMGNGLPKGEFSMVNTFRYKGISLMIDLNYSYGAKIMGVSTTMLENRQLISNSVKSVLNAWTPENQNSMIAALRLPSDPNFGENEKDSHMIFNGDYLRIRNISLYYDFNPRLLRSLKVVSGLSIGVSVENLHVFTKYPGFDPEIGVFSADDGQSIDFYSYPRPTTVSANIKIVF